MNFDREFARELCEQLGIEWDSHAPVPTLQGVALDRDDLHGLFASSMSFRYEANTCVQADRGNRPYDDSDDDRLCA